MKICFVRQMPYPYTIGGGTTYMNDLISALLKKGQDVSVITSRPSKNDERIKNDKPDGVKITYVGLRHRKFGKGFLPLDLIYRFFFELIFMISSFFAIKRLKPDVIHTQTLVAESFLLSILNVPFVATVYGLPEGLKELWSKRKNKTAVLLSYLYKWVGNFCARKAKLMIIATTKETQDYYKRLGKTILLGSGITLSKFNLHSKKKKKLYLSLSRLSEQKGLSYLFEALQILDNKGVKLEFNIVGDGDKDYVAMLKEKSGKLKNIKVNFLGWITGRKKLEIYRAAEVYVLPSIFEPFGITVLEAMASECAIIASDCEGPKQVVKSGFGEIINYKDEKKRAENLALAIQKSLRWNVAKMGKKAREEVKKYDYDIIVNKYLEIYKQNKINR